MTILPESVQPSLRRVPDWRLLLSHPAHFLSLGLGSGLMRPAPGTWGSLASWPLYLLMAHWLTPMQIVWACLPLFVLGVFCCARTGKALGVVDHGAIVWDEMVACWLLFALTPAALWSQLLALLLFRLFDISKPWPIRWLDARMKNGFGVMLDDLLAMLFAWVVHILLWPRLLPLLPH
ncbi:phosphatidylglycerophosphatase A [Leeia sp.]